MLQYTAIKSYFFVPQSLTETVNIPIYSGCGLLLVAALATFGRNCSYTIKEMLELLLMPPAFQAPLLVWVTYIHIHSSKQSWLLFSVHQTSAAVRCQLLRVNLYTLTIFSIHTY